MRSDEIRLVLNASLDNIARGHNLEENVTDSVGALRHAFEIADATALHIERGRQNSEWLWETHNFDSLEKVGLYEVHFDRTKKGRTISFAKPAFTVEFLFKKGEYDMVDSVMGAITSGRNYKPCEIQHATNTLLFDQLSGRDVRNVGEAILGSRGRSLHGYELDSISLYTLGSWPIVKLPRIRRKIVYPVR